MPNPHTKQDKKDHAGWIVTMFGLQNAPTHVMCRTCKQIKPRADFVYLMSRTQTKGLGKAGTARQAALSMFCDRCRPKEMRPVKSLPRGELLKHAAGGDIHPYIAQQVLRERRRSHAAKISAVQQKRWLKVYTDGWARPMYELRREIKWVQASIKRFTSPDWVLPEHKTLGHEAFLQTYHTELQAARSRYTLECRKPHHPDRLPVPILMPGSLPPSWYASLIPPARLAALTRMHKASATEINETYGPRDWPWTTSATSTS